jgi:GNAT superfamily N-acetyltransferase
MEAPMTVPPTESQASGSSSAAETLAEMCNRAALTEEARRCHLAEEGRSSSSSNSIDDDDDESEDDAEDADYQPYLTTDDAGEAGTKRKLKQVKKKAKKKVELPDFDMLSLPKANVRADAELNLSASSLYGCLYEELEMHSLGRRKMPKGSPKDASVLLLLGHEDGGPSAADDPLVAQFVDIYRAQLPGLGDPYDDGYMALLTLDGEREHVSGGATYRVLQLTKSDGSIVLVLDVLAVAVSDDAKGMGVGSLLLSSLKRIARREARLWECERALLLTQADNACISFWERKGGFMRALDAASLCRSLRREVEYTMFEGATPMACVLPKGGPPRKASRRRRKSLCALSSTLTASHKMRIEARAPLKGKAN